MKKMLSFIMTTVLCLGMAVNVYAAESPSVDNSTGKLSVPTGLTWSDNWDPQWNVVPEAMGYYDIEVYKDGELFYSTNWSVGTFATEKVEVNLSPEINESGSYTFRVASSNSYDTDNLISSDYSELSEAKVYTRPEKALGTTVGYWDTEKEGLFHYYGVENAGGYRVSLYVVEDDGSSYCRYCSWWVGDTNYDTTDSLNDYDFTSDIKETGKYYVTVQALSADIATIANGAEGGKSEIFDTAKSAEKVEGVLDSLDLAGNPTEALATLKEELPVSSLRTAMQTDESVLNKMKTLEESYVAEKNITVSSSSSEGAEKYVDASKISMVGAALNAGTGNVNLALTEPETKIDVPSNRYANSVQLDLKLWNDGESKSELEIPITITMPIPTGLSTDRLTILHYHQDGTREVINPRVNADNTLTFTVTKFSTFVFANALDTGDSGLGDGEGTTMGSSGASGSQEIAFSAADGTAMRWISSEQNNNISVSGSQTTIPEGAIFNASRIYSGEEANRVANAVANSKGNVNYVAYDFSLTTAGGVPITTFAKHVDVSMPIPNEFSLEEGKVLSVYYVTADGKLERCNSIIDGNFVTFGTTHFSTFVYIEETAKSAASTPVANASVKSPKTAESNMNLYLIMLVAMALGVVVYGTRKVKYNK